ncbi:protein SIX6OS1-like [Thalassophryne amazonica]|uniref:protein SIX6OS1-like n=1 Tax=Thalassophryne amazonica TaxID=390379 RepID=UPI0014723A42|nr:protein SIX6OS1-like [Thalassophryne amazonica]
MDNEVSLCDIDNLLFQLVLQTRFLAQKKNELNQEIKVCRDDIAENRSYNETTQKNIKKLDDEIKVLQNAVKQKKEDAKSVKVTNSLLLQYEQTLKAELDKRKESYNHDMREYEERIASCRKTFQEHKEYYTQNPLAQKLLMTQAEKEEIESRIKVCDDQITMKQQELDKLKGQAAISNSTDKEPDSVSSQQPVNEPMQQFDNQAEGSYSDIYPHVNQPKDGHQLSEDKGVYEIQEDFNIHDTPAGCPTEETNHKLQSYQHLHGMLEGKQI